MNGSGTYWELVRQLAKRLANREAVADFQGVVLALADLTARAMTNLALTQQQVDQYRGQLSFCYKIAEDVGTALTEHQGAANAQGSEGFPKAPR